MSVIWKYQVHIRGDNKPNAIAMPAGATILSAGVQADQIMVWVKCDLEAKPETRYLQAVMTGEPFDAAAMSFLGTVHLFAGKIVAHVFEVKP